MLFGPFPEKDRKKRKKNWNFFSKNIFGEFCSKFFLEIVFDKIFLFSHWNKKFSKEYFETSVGDPENLLFKKRNSYLKLPNLLYLYFSAKLNLQNTI